MKEVYIVLHVRDNEGCEEIKIIGVFSEIFEAESAVKSLRMQKGFSEYKDGFEINKYCLDRINWSEGFTKEI